MVVSKNNPTGLTNLRTFVQNGGGLLFAGTAWAGDTNDIGSYWANVILQDTGIFCIPIYSYGSDKVCDGECFDTTTNLLLDTNSFQIWQDLMKLDWRQQTMPRERVKQMMEVLFDRFRYGPTNETLNTEVITEAQRILSHIPTTVPTPNAPVIQETEKQFIIAHRYWAMLINSVGVRGDIPSHPAATVFPGIPSAPKTFPNRLKDKRIKEIGEIDGRINWTVRSTRR